MKNPDGRGEDRLDRIEAGLERIEVAFEKSVHEHTLRFQKTVEMQADTWRAIDALSALHKDLAEAQKATDEKLNILIDTVDRLIRRRDRKSDPPESHT